MAPMTRRWLRPLWTVIALLFLMEAWLWDHLEPVVARIVNIVPWGRFKTWIQRTIQNLPPWAALGVFVVPAIVLLPLKFLEVYFLAKQNWLGAVGVLLLAKLMGLGTTAFVFDATRDKLLQMAWFVRVYDWFMGARQWALAQTEPIRARILRLTWLLKPQRASRFVRRFMRLRRRAYRSRPA
jgi:hypothetical protein